MSVLPPNLVRWTYLLNAVVLVHSLNLLYYNDVSVTSKFSKVQRPYPPLAHAVLLLSSVYVWSRSLSFHWAGLWSAAKEIIEGSDRRCIARRVSRFTRGTGTT